MKKTKIVYKKVAGKLIPEHMDIYFGMLAEVDEGAFIQADYSDVKVSKSCDQLGYLFSGIYPHLCYWFAELWGPILYYRKIRQWTVPVPVSVKSVDEFMKDLFSATQGEEFKKRFTSQDVMAKYIDFLDKFSIENFETPIPPPKYNGVPNEA